MIKLPKQWKHWCADSKLRVCDNKGFYLKGRGRHWRLNCHEMFECGDTYDEFDRWARCKIESVLMPKTRAEFRTVVKHLLELQKESK